MNLLPKRRIAYIGLPLALLVALLGSTPPGSEAHGLPVPPAPASNCNAAELAAPHDMVPGLGGPGEAPTLGWWTTRDVVATVATPRNCQRWYFELEPGTEAYVRVQLFETPGTPVGPLAATAVVWCSWTGGTCAGPLHHPAAPVAYSAKVENPIAVAGRTGHSFEVLLLGVGTARVVLAYGALPNNLRDGPGNRPWEVPADRAKLPFTGDYDHLPYADPSALGADESLLPAWQNDADQGGDAGNTMGAPTPAYVIPLRLGTRSVYVNNRLGAHATDTPATPSTDPSDWYKFTVQPGAQVVVNLWPTRWDNYGGGFAYEFWRVSPITGAGEVQCSGRVLPPYEPVMNPALDCSMEAGWVPHRNAGTFPADANARPTDFYLHVNASGFVRYSMTVDYLGDLLVPQAQLGDDCFPGPGRETSPLNGC